MAILMQSYNIIIHFLKSVPIEFAVLEEHSDQFQDCSTADQESQDENPCFGNRELGLLLCVSWFTLLVDILLCKLGVSLPLLWGLKRLVG